MTLDEFTVVMKARRFVAKVKPAAIPVPMQPYLNEVALFFGGMRILDPTSLVGR